MWVLVLFFGGLLVGGPIGMLVACFIIGLIEAAKGLLGIEKGN